MDTTKWWPSIEVRCWNYRTKGISRGEVVSIETDRFCHSDCEATNCPIHKSKMVVPDSMTKEPEKK